MSMWLNPNSIYSQIQVTAGLRKVKPHYFFSPDIFRYWKVTSALKWKSTKPLKNNWVWITVRAVEKSTLIAFAIKAKSGSMVMFLSASCLHLSTSLNRLRFHQRSWRTNIARWNPSISHYSISTSAMASPVRSQTCSTRHSLNSIKSFIVNLQNLNFHLRTGITHIDIVPLWYLDYSSFTVGNAQIEIKHAAKHVMTQQHHLHDYNTVHQL